VHPSDAPPPLAGIRVLAIEQMQALPFATQLLAHLGAEVVKVEAPGAGESGRAGRIAARDEKGRPVGATFLRNALGKRSIAIDLKTPEGVALVHRLAPHFDVVAENFKPGTADRLGIGYEALRENDPALIFVSVSGFGELGDSPYRSWPAYATVAEAMGGFYEGAREPEELPRAGQAGALGDISAALFATIGILAAIRRRDTSGIGSRVDISMYDAMLAMCDIHPFLWSMGVRDQGRARVAGVMDAFRARDGFFVIQALRPQHRDKLARAVGYPEWLEDERLAEARGWTTHLETLVRPGIEEWAGKLTRVEACEVLAQAGIAVGPVNGPGDIASDPHVEARQMLLEVDRPDGDPLLVVGNPVKFDAIEAAPAPSWPRLAADTADVLRSVLELGDAEIEDLARRGVIEVDT
jgi:formyl-CoA transferase